VSGSRRFHGFHHDRFHHHGGHHSRIFFSIGGFWPWWYDDFWPYYWGGYYPYYWYRPYPYGYWIGPGASNYYSYNYETPPAYSYGVPDPNYDAFRQARQRLEQQQAQQQQDQQAGALSTTQADRDFDDGVTAFEKGDYGLASLKFALAAQADSEDVVRPFAHSQALFAAGEYHKAAEVLRSAIANTEPEKEGVFYPRGLYKEDSLLENQVSRLVEAANANPEDYDLQLLAAYHNLGLNKLGEARSHMEKAQSDSVNGPAAKALLTLVDKLEKAAESSENAEKQPAEK
jgi:hypothetical protein